MPDVVPEDEDESSVHEITLVPDTTVTRGTLRRLSDDTYNAILHIVRNFGRQLETTPEIIKPHGEEHIRHFLLLVLNTHFPAGAATGETFRVRGKSDIRIETEERAAFIAENKIWDGIESLKEAVDQLFRYTTVRDTKCAVLLFNKHRKGYTELLQKVSEYLDATGFAYTVVADGEWRVVMPSPKDPQSRFTIHVFLFDYYVDGDEV